MGPGAVDVADPNAPASPEPAAADPALMLGDPSNLRLRDPGQNLQLDLDE